jgi:hypothetical protein
MPAGGQSAALPVHGFFVTETLQGDPVAHYLYHCVAIGMNKISNVESIFLGMYLHRLNPRAFVLGSTWRVPDVDTKRVGQLIAPLEHNILA